MNNKLIFLSASKPEPFKWITEVISEINLGVSMHFGFMLTHILIYYGTSLQFVVYCNGTKVKGLAGLATCL